MQKIRGFTLVEILIVVLILGILAAIVIPQFTNASTDARNSALATTLQTVRSQINLFKSQHAGVPPNKKDLWAMLTGKSNTGDTKAAVATGIFGPYLTSAPVNPINGQSVVGTSANKKKGWVYIVTNNDYTLQAINTSGKGVLTY